MITPKYSNPTVFFAPVRSQEFLASVCRVSFSPLVYFFMLLEYIEATLSLYLCVMVFWGICSLPCGMMISSSFIEDQ